MWQGKQRKLKGDITWLYLSMKLLGMLSYALGIMF